MEKVKASQDTLAKLQVIDSLLDKSFYAGEYDVFIPYSIEYIEMAKSIDSIEWAAKKAMNLQAPLSSYENDPIKAVRIIDGVLAHKYKIKDSFLLGGLYLKRGRANEKIDLKLAIEDFDKALDNFAVNDSVHRADAYLFSGRANSNLGRFVKASEKFEIAYRIYEDLKDYQYMTTARQGIITMFSRSGFYEKAEKERQKLIETLKNLENQRYLVTEYYNQALDYAKIGATDKELRYLGMALDLLNDTDPDETDYVNRVNIHSKYAEYYTKAYQYQKARDHIKMLDAWAPKITYEPTSLSNYHGAKARYFQAIGSLNKALEHGKEKLRYAENVGHEDEVMNAHLLLSGIYADRGNFKKSLENKNAYLDLRDSIYNKAAANSLAYYQSLYEIEKKEKELMEKNTNIQLLEKDNESFKKIVFFSSLALVLTFGLILLYRNQRHLRINKYLQEKFSQELLVSQEQERRRISKDLHDGLGQRLLLIKNKIVANGDETTMSMVDTAIEEVRTISRDLHPFQLQEMGITKAIEHSLTQIDENTSLFVSSQIENIDGLFSKEQEVNIYRIVQESLNNIIKHANAEATKVLVKKIRGNVLISIKDNGVGFDFNAKLQNVKSLGLKTLMERTKFLNGQMKVKSTKGIGTTLVFQFPA
ncbi:sensor histidine kinase [Flavobacteriaceae bacterium TK19130]|nr:sensor histidine kinase [Thermobacterium salinum]